MGQRDLRITSPMIDQTLAHEAARGEAIERMRVALDSIEVEGLGQTLPFLSRDDHPKFDIGDMTRLHRRKKYPDGFEGVEMARVTEGIAAHFRPDATAWPNPAAAFRAR